jgi:hypothetical protein
MALRHDNRVTESLVAVRKTPAGFRSGRGLLRGLAKKTVLKRRHGTTQSLRLDDGQVTNEKARPQGSTGGRVILRVAAFLTAV